MVLTDWNFPSWEERAVRAGMHNRDKGESWRPGCARCVGNAREVYKSRVWIENFSHTSWLPPLLMCEVIVDLWPCFVQLCSITIPTVTLAMIVAVFKAMTSLQRRDEEDVDLGWAGPSLHNLHCTPADPPTASSRQDPRGDTILSELPRRQSGRSQTSERVMLPAGANKWGRRGAARKSLREQNAKLWGKTNNRWANCFFSHVLWHFKKKTEEHWQFLLFSLLNIWFVFLFCLGILQ